MSKVATPHEGPSTGEPAPAGCHGFGPPRMRCGILSDQDGRPEPVLADGD
jgi:hypothetical protein